MENYLHGVETVIVSDGVTPVSVIKTAVVGLVGIAPAGPKQTLTMVSSPKDAAAFGGLVPGFNIPAALAAIFAQGPATVLVVNVFDETAHTTAVVNEAVAVSGLKFKTAFAPVASVVVKNAAGTTTYVNGTDYKFDAYGNFKIISGVIAEGAALTVSYKKLNPAGVTAANLVGSISADGDRTGFKTFALALNTFGFNPKILIAPGYSDLNGVRAEMLIAAEAYRAICLIDAPEGATVSETLADRGPAGLNFNTHEKRAVLCYPYLKAYDPASDSDILQPYSQFVAGLLCATDYNEGYHVSPSNQKIKGFTGVERQLTAAINDPQSEVNQLNAAGILTIFNAYGSGLRSWGNRNAAYPSETGVTTFIPVLRVSDIVKESIELAMLPFIDRPINLAVVDSIKETVNEFLRTLIGRGALVDGKCTFSRANNSDLDIAAGKLTFDYSLMPPTPLERVTFNHFIDISLLKAIK